MIVKPDTLVWQEQVQHYQGCFRKVIAASFAFKLSCPNQIFHEREVHALWSKFMPDQPIDETYPKTLSEVLVVGRFIAAPDNSQGKVRVKIGLIDKVLHYALMQNFAPLTYLAPIANLDVRRSRFRPSASWEKYPVFSDRVNPLFFQRASLDQTQRMAFAPGLAFKLEGMHAGGLIVGQLPLLCVRMFVQTQAQVCKEIPSVCDTLWFFPDADLGLMTFRGLDVVADWNGNDHQVLMLVLEDMRAPKTQEFFTQVLARMTGPERHLYRSSQEGLVPDAVIGASVGALTKKAQRLRMLHSAGTKSLLSAARPKIVPAATLKAKLAQQNLIEKADFAYYDFSGMSFVGKVLQDVNFLEANLIDADFTEATLKNVNFNKTQLTGAKFLQAQLSDVNFTDQEFHDNNFNWAQFKQCRFNQGMWVQVQFNHSSFHECQFFKIYGQELQAINVVLQKCLLTQGMLMGVEFAYAQFYELRVHQQCFQNVKFSKSRGDRNGFVGAQTYFACCQWRNCVWTDSNFLEAQFVDCAIVDSAFPKSEWLAVHWSGMELLASDFVGNAFNDACLERCVFQSCNLMHVRGLGVRVDALQFQECFPDVCF